MTPYISLGNRAKGVVILGAGAMFFYNLLFAFTMPVVLPSLLERYGVMEHYALLNGLNSLISCVVTPLGGKLGDRFGRRRLAIAASAVRLGLMLCCAVPTSGGVFFALYLTGNLAGGLLNSIPYAILGDVTDLRERPKWFGVFGTVNGVALLAGLLGGGVIVDFLGPFAAFLFFAPFGALSLVCLAACYPNKTTGSGSGLDRAGMVLLALGLAAILSWCNFGGVAFPRISPLGITLLVVGAALLFLLVRHEGRADDPIFDPRFFRNKSFLLSAATYLLIGPMVCLCSSTLTMYGQVGLGLSATVSGTLALPKNIIFFVLPTFLGAWIAKDRRRFKPIFLLCGGCIALASLLCCFWDTQTSVLTIYAVMVIFGVGTSCQSVIIQPYMHAAVASEDLGSATAVLQFANSMGNVIFTSAYSILYNARYLAATAPGGAGEAVAIAQAFSGVAVVSAVAGVGIMAATLLLMPRRQTAKVRA